MLKLSISRVKKKADEAGLVSLTDKV